MNQEKKQENLPRALDLDKTFISLASWVAETANEANGLVVSLDGTDSTLTFLLCSEALKISKKNPKNLIGIHYGENYKYKNWLKEYGTVKVVNLPKSKILQTDIYRWAALQSFALKHKFWIVGSRNKTESLLGDYSNASNIAVMQPLSTLWKSEILSLCQYLKVPQEMISESLVGDPDCNCHRPGLMGRLAECEKVLAAKQGEIDPKIPKTLGQKHSYKDASQFLKLFTKGKTHKSKLPYRPPENMVIVEEATLQTSVKVAVSSKSKS